MDPTLVVLIVLALGFAFLNGVHDSCNLVSTMISSRAIRPQVALILASIAEFSGPFIFGVAVANTIGNEIVSSAHLNLNVIIAGLIGAISWNLITWVLSIPSSSSHALVGGLVGAVAISIGFSEIQLHGVLKVVLFLFISPVIGFITGVIITNLVFLLSWKATPRVNNFFKKAQIATSLGLAMGSGANDAQKTMGVITLGLVISGLQRTFTVPFWTVLACALAISLGVALGGYRLIRTLGSKFYKIRPVHGFASQAASAVVILAASLLGGPVSATQIVSTSIMGVGAAERVSKVRWGVAGDLISAWLFTIPSAGLLAAGAYWLITSGVPALIALF
jgi:PiT family inorganic phosphate transporter